MHQQRAKRNNAVRYAIATVAGVVAGLIGGVAATYVFGSYLSGTNLLEARFPDEWETIPGGGVVLLFMILPFFVIMGIANGTVVCLDRAGLSRNALVVAYLLMASLVLLTGIGAVLVFWSNPKDSLIKIVFPLLIWSLTLELRAVSLIRHPHR